MVIIYHQADHIRLTNHPSCIKNQVNFFNSWNFRHGFGTLSNRKSNSTFSLEYRGDWVKGKPEGVGWRYYENDDVYFGYWKQGRRHGYGKMWYKDGTFYVGYWKMNKKDGLGMLVQGNSDEIN